MSQLKWNGYTPQTCGLIAVFQQLFMEEKIQWKFQGYLWQRIIENSQILGTKSWFNLLLTSAHKERKTSKSKLHIHTTALLASLQSSEVTHTHTISHTDTHTDTHINTLVHADYRGDGRNRHHLFCSLFSCLLFSLKQNEIESWVTLPLLVSKHSLIHWLPQLDHICHLIEGSHSRRTQRHLRLLHRTS